MEHKSNTEAKPSDIFVMKKANDWTGPEPDFEVPKMLFGEFWRESELAVLFANCGLGKSVLAMQIAETIAWGASIEPFQMTAEPQKVLYFDLDLTGHQFAMRYAAEIEIDGRSVFTDKYEFSDDLIRVEINPNAELGELTAQSFAAAIEALAVETGARVLVIDNISLLKRATGSSRDEILLMKHLDRLKRKHGLSILVVATSSRRDEARPLAMSDLRASRMLCNYSDSAFAIGRSRSDASFCYIKQLRSKNSEMLYDATVVPMFKIDKLGGNFLGVEFCKYGDEADQLRDPEVDREADLLDLVKELRDDGHSYSEIGERLGISKTSAHRLRMKWRPRRARQVRRDEVNPYDFPGCEEYNAAFHDPKFKHLYEPGHPEELTYAGDYILLEKAKHEAKKEFDRTGKAPTLAEMLTRLQESPPRTFEATDPYQIYNDPPEEEVPIPGTRRDIDKNGREIFVEEYSESGKPLKFYRRDSRQRLHRWERNSGGIINMGIVEITRT